MDIYKCNTHAQTYIYWIYVNASSLENVMQVHFSTQGGMWQKLTARTGNFTNGLVKAHIHQYYKCIVF